MTDASLQIPGASHCQAPMRDVVKRVRDGLRELFVLPDGHEVVLGNCGSTAFWDTAACGLASVTGAAPFLVNPLVVSAPPSDAPEPMGDPSVDAITTSTTTAVDVGQADVYYFAPQKAFGSDGGPCPALVSQAAIDPADVEALTACVDWLVGNMA